MKPKLPTKLSPTETKILKRTRELCKFTEKEALAEYNKIRKALGATGEVSSPWQFGSYSDGNSKLGKNDSLYIGGVTYAPAMTVSQFWLAAAPAYSNSSIIADVQKALRVSFEEFRNCLFHSNLCMKSTKGCRSMCNLRTSGRMGMENKGLKNSGQYWWEGNIVRAQLARTILLLVRPNAAITLMKACVKRTAAVAKRDGKEPRWRLAVADDIRWERVAPSILELCRELDVGMYAYTKFNDEARSEVKDVKFVRSASERTKVEQVRDMVDNNQTVAVVFDTKRHEDVPKEWLGMKVIDGDAHDDRTADPDGVIVALRAKGDAVGSKSKFIFPADQIKAMKRRERELV